MPSTILTNLSPQDDALLRSALGFGPENTTPLTEADLELIKSLDLDVESLDVFEAVNRASEGLLALQGEDKYLGSAPIGPPVQASIETSRAAVNPPNPSMIKTLTHDLINQLELNGQDIVTIPSSDAKGVMLKGKRKNKERIMIAAGFGGMIVITNNDKMPNTRDSHANSDKAMRRALIEKGAMLDEEGKTKPRRKGIYYKVDGFDVHKMKSSRKGPDRVVETYSSLNLVRQVTEINLARVAQGLSTGRSQDPVDPSTHRSIGPVDHTAAITAGYLKAIKAQGYSNHPDIKVIDGRVYAILEGVSEDDVRSFFIVTLARGVDELRLSQFEEFPARAFDGDSWRNYFTTRDTMKKAIQPSRIAKKVRLFLREGKFADSEPVRQFLKYPGQPVSSERFEVFQNLQEYGVAHMARINGRSLEIRVVDKTEQPDQHFVLSFASEKAQPIGPSAPRPIGPIDHSQPITADYLKSLKPDIPSTGLRASHPDVFFVEETPILFIKAPFGSEDTLCLFFTLNTQADKLVASAWVVPNELGKKDTLTPSQRQHARSNFENQAKIIDHIRGKKKLDLEFLKMFREQIYKSGKIMGQDLSVTMLVTEISTTEVKLVGRKVQVGHNVSTRETRYDEGYPPSEAPINGVAWLERLAAEGLIRGVFKLSFQTLTGQEKQVPVALFYNADEFGFMYIDDTSGVSELRFIPFNEEQKSYWLDFFRQLAENNLVELKLTGERGYRFHGLVYHSENSVLLTTHGRLRAGPQTMSDGQSVEIKKRQVILSGKEHSEVKGAFRLVGDNNVSESFSAEANYYWPPSFQNPGEANVDVVVIKELCADLIKALPRDHEDIFEGLPGIKCVWFYDQEGHRKFQVIMVDEALYLVPKDAGLLKKFFEDLEQARVGNNKKGKLALRYKINSSGKTQPFKGVYYKIDGGKIYEMKKEKRRQRKEGKEDRIVREFSSPIVDSFIRGASLSTASQDPATLRKPITDNRSPIDPSTHRPVEPSNQIDHTQPLSADYLKALKPDTHPSVFFIKDKPYYYIEGHLQEGTMNVGFVTLNKKRDALVVAQWFEMPDKGMQTPTGFLSPGNNPEIKVANEITQKIRSVLKGEATFSQSDIRVLQISETIGVELTPGVEKKLPNVGAPTQSYLTLKERGLVIRHINAGGYENFKYMYAPGEAPIHGPDWLLTPRLDTSIPGIFRVTYTNEDGNLVTTPVALMATTEGLYSLLVPNNIFGQELTFLSLFDWPDSKSLSELFQRAASENVEAITLDDVYSGILNKIMDSSPEFVTLTEQGVLIQMPIQDPLFGQFEVKGRAIVVENKTQPDVGGVFKVVGDRDLRAVTQEPSLFTEINPDLIRALPEDHLGVSDLEIGLRVVWFHDSENKPRAQILAWENNLYVLPLGGDEARQFYSDIGDVVAGIKKPTGLVRRYQVGADGKTQSHKGIYYKIEGSKILKLEKTRKRKSSGESPRDKEVLALRSAAVDDFITLKLSPSPIDPSAPRPLGPIDHSQPITVDYLKAIQVQGYSDHPDIKIIKGRTFVVYKDEAKDGVTSFLVVTLKESDGELGYFSIRVCPERFFDKDQWRQHFETKSEMLEARADNRENRKLGNYLSKGTDISSEDLQYLLSPESIATVRQGVATAITENPEVGEDSTVILEDRALVYNLRKRGTNFKFEKRFHLASEAQDPDPATQFSTAPAIHRSIDPSTQIDHTQPITADYLKAIKAQGHSDHPDIKVIEGKVFVFLEKRRDNGLLETNVVTLAEGDKELGVYWMYEYPESAFKKNAWRHHFKTKKGMVEERDTTRRYRRLRKLMRGESVSAGPNLSDLLIISDMRQIKQGEPTRINHPTDSSRYGVVVIHGREMVMVDKSQASVQEKVTTYSLPSETQDTLDPSTRRPVDPVTQPDIPKTGIENFELARIQPDPSELDITGLEDWVLYEDSNGTGYGVALKGRRESGGALDASVDTFLVYRRKQGQTISSFHDLMAHHHKHGVFHINSLAEIARKPGRSISFEDPFVGRIGLPESYSFLFAALNKFPESIVIDLKKSFPPVVDSPTAASVLVNQEYENEIYDPATMALGLYRDVPAAQKKEGYHVVRQAFQIEADSGTWMFTVKISTSGKVQNVLFITPDGQKVVGDYQEVTVNEERYKEAKKQYVITAKHGSKRVVLHYLAPYVHKLPDGKRAFRYSHDSYFIERTITGNKTQERDVSSTRDTAAARPHLAAPKLTAKAGDPSSDSLAVEQARLDEQERLVAEQARQAEQRAQLAVEIASAQRKLELRKPHINISWPGRSKKTNDAALLTREPLQLSILSINNAGTDSYRFLTPRLEENACPRGMEVILQWGEGAGQSVYQARTQKNVLGERELVLTPRLASGAPEGDVVIGLKTNTLSIPDKNSEAYKYLFGRFDVPVLALSFDGDDIVISGQKDTHAQDLLLDDVWAQWEGVDGLDRPEINADGSWELRASVGERLSKDRARLYNIGVAYQSLLNRYSLRPLSSWMRYVESFDLPAVSLQIVDQEASQEIEAKVTRRVDNGNTASYLNQLTIRGENALGIQRGFFLIDGTLMTSDHIQEMGIPLSVGAKLLIRRDTDLGWEDVALMFNGDHFTEIDSRFVSYSDQTVFRTTHGAHNALTLIQSPDEGLLEDDSFSFRFSLYEDYRSEDSPKPLRIRSIDVRTLLTQEELDGMGLDLPTTLRIVSYPEDMRQGGDVVVEWGSLGRIAFSLAWASEDDFSKITVTRTPFPVHANEHNSDVDDDAALINVAGQEFMFEVERRSPRTSGSRSFRVVSQEAAEALKKGMRLMGRPFKETAPVEGKEKVTTVDKVPVMDEQGNVINERVRFSETNLNSDGSKPLKSLYLTRKEFLMWREAIDGIGTRHASLEDPEVLTTEPSILAHPTSLEIPEGQFFSPTKETLAWLKGIYTDFGRYADKESAEHKLSPFPEEASIEQRLEFESEEGLVISVPVKWRVRKKNPFVLDDQGRFKKDEDNEFVLVGGVPEIETGKRIETYIKGRPDTRRPVDYQFTSHDQGGRWGMYAMEGDNNGKVRKGFHLKVAHYVYRDGHGNVKYKSPVVFGLVNVVDEKGSLDNEKQFITRAQAALETQIVAAYSTTDRQALAEPMHVPFMHREGDGSVVQLAFASPDHANVDCLAELKGFRLDRSSYRVDFDENITLTLRSIDENSSVLETISLEHSFSSRDRVVRLREVKADGSYGRLFVWNLGLETITQTQYDPFANLNHVMDPSESNRALRLLRSHNIPVFSDMSPEDRSRLPKEVVGDKLAATLRFERDDIAVLDNVHSGNPVPEQEKIGVVRDVNRALALIERLPMHGASLYPDELTAVRQNLTGGERELMTFADGNFILQASLRARDEHPYDYLFDTVADPVTGYPRIRVLIRNPEIYEDKYHDALVNEPFSLFEEMPSSDVRTKLFKGGINPLSFRAYQDAALREFAAANLQRSSDKLREGSIILPTGAGKTRVAAGAMAVSLLQGVLSGRFKLGDKFVVTTHLPDNIPHLAKTIKDVFGPVFERLMGRSLNISSVAGSQEDASGDVVILGIQKATHESYDLNASLKKALGSHKIHMTVMDEVHHGEANTWQVVRDHIRAISPEMYLLGLTATPDGSEPHVLHRESLIDLMKAGVLPPVHLVEIASNQHVDKLLSGRFTRTEARSRNQIIFEHLERLGNRRVDNERALAPTQYTALSVRDAHAFAEDYVAYFGRGANQTLRNGHSYVDPKHPLCARNIEILRPNSERGQISVRAINEMVLKKERGEIDGIVLVASGANLPAGSDARKLVEKYRLDGTIEATATAGLWQEGSDLWYIKNIIPKATKSQKLKQQMVGRPIRRGPDDVDYRTGRLINDVPPVVFDVQDIYTTGPLYTAREALGMNALIRKGVRYDVVNNREYQQEPEMLDITPCVAVHSKRHAGKERKTLEMGIGDKQFVFRSVHVNEKETYGGRRIFGLVCVEKGKRFNMGGEALCGLKEWVAYLRLNSAPDILKHVATMINAQGNRNFVLSDGKILSVNTERDDVAHRQFVLKGVRRIRGADGVKAVVAYKKTDGTQGTFNMYLMDKQTSAFYLEDCETGTFYTAIINREGRLQMWERRKHIKEILLQPSSAGYEMKSIIGSTEYIGRRESYATRKPLEEDEGYQHEVTAVLGRYKGSHSRATSEYSIDTEVARVRFEVGVDKQGNLQARLGNIREHERANEEKDGLNFVFGEGGDTEVRIVEDTWTDARTGELTRGRVRVFFYRKDVMVKYKGGDVKGSPYGWIEFENRDALAGRPGQFKVSSAHYHQANYTRTADKYNKLPENAGFLLEGSAGFFCDGRADRDLAEMLEELVADFVTKGQDRAQIYKLLKGVRNGSVADQAAILSAISILDQYHNVRDTLGRQEAPFISEKGLYDRHDVSELAEVALDKPRVKQLKRAVTAPDKREDVATTLSLKPEHKFGLQQIQNHGMPISRFTPAHDHEAPIRPFKRDFSTRVNLNSPMTQGLDTLAMGSMGSMGLMSSASTMMRPVGMF
jgi:superfamily II DNA or RNA helicase